MICGSRFYSGDIRDPDLRFCWHILFDEFQRRICYLNLGKRSKIDRLLMLSKILNFIG